MSQSAVTHTPTVQRPSISNQAMQRLLARQTIQPKLTINEPGDEFEREADRVAEQVMCMPERAAAEKSAIVPSIGRPIIQRLYPECEEKLHRQPIKEEEEEEFLQAKELIGATPEVTPAVEAQVGLLQGGGQPLAESVRNFFEPRFGYDFSQVRIHAGTRAIESAQAVNARAYTLGQDIVFGAGEYDPHTASGGLLLAHELTHTLQQARLGSMQVPGHPSSKVDERSDGPAATIEINRANALASCLQRLVPDTGASTSAPANGINSLTMTPTSVADPVDQTTGHPQGHSEGVDFALHLSNGVSPSDFAIVQRVQGSMSFRDAAGTLRFIQVNLHGALRPFHFHNWVVDSVNTSPEFGTTHSPPVSVNGRLTEWGDEPGIDPTVFGAELPVPTRFKVWFRTGVYRRPIPPTVAAFQSANPTPLVEIRWAVHWRNEGSPPRIINKPITPM